MDAGKFQLITEADYVLSPCGRFVPPVGSVVYIPKSFLIQAVLPLASEQTFYKEITGDTTWCWRSIAIALSGNPPAISAQVLAPDDGHFLFNGLLDLTAIAGFGSNRFLLSREIECPPGSKIVLSLDDNFLSASAVQPVSMLCGGAYAYYLKNGIRSKWDSGLWSYTAERQVSALPRIFAGPNQNILAPCWMNGLGPKTPAGSEDTAFTYGDGNSNLAKVTLGGVLSAKASIQIDDTYDFQVRRFLFDVIPDAGVTAGSFLVRIRAGSGFVFTDEYLDMAKYSGSAYWAKGWDIKHGDQMQFDLTLVDGAGSGSISIQCFADGVRRRVK
jgi:hypothetical protein